MPWTCAVPNCRTNKDKRNEKVSVFIVKNENFGAKWAALIPGIERLRTGQRICEKHFEERYIIREYIKYDNNGKIIAQVKSFDLSIKIFFATDNDKIFYYCMILIFKYLLGTIKTYASTTRSCTYNI